MIVTQHWRQLLFEASHFTFFLILDAYQLFLFVSQYFPRHHTKIYLVFLLLHLSANKAIHLHDTDGEVFESTAQWRVVECLAWLGGAFLDVLINPNRLTITKIKSFVIITVQSFSLCFHFLPSSDRQIVVVCRHEKFLCVWHFFSAVKTHPWISDGRGCQWE